MNGNGVRPAAPRFSSAVADWITSHQHSHGRDTGNPGPLFTLLHHTTFIVQYSFHMFSPLTYPNFSDIFRVFLFSSFLSFFLPLSPSLPHPTSLPLCLPPCLPPCPSFLLAQWVAVNPIVMLNWFSEGRQRARETTEGGRAALYLCVEHTPDATCALKFCHFLVLSKLSNSLSRLRRALSGLSLGVVCVRVPEDQPLSPGARNALCRKRSSVLGHLLFAFSPFLLTWILFLNESRTCSHKGENAFFSPVITPSFSSSGVHLVPLPGWGLEEPGSERCLAGHGEQRSGGAPAGGGRRGRRRRPIAGGGPAAGRSAVGLHGSGRPGARWAAYHLQGTVFHMNMYDLLGCHIDI